MAFWAVLSDMGVAIHFLHWRDFCNEPWKSDPTYAACVFEAKTGRNGFKRTNQHIFSVAFNTFSAPVSHCFTSLKFHLPRVSRASDPRIKRL